MDAGFGRIFESLGFKGFGGLGFKVFGGSVGIEGLWVFAGFSGFRVRVWGCRGAGFRGLVFLCFRFGGSGLSVPLQFSSFMFPGLRCGVCRVCGVGSMGLRRRVWSLEAYGGSGVVV